MSAIAQTPEPPYYVVIFTALLTNDTEGYAERAEALYELAAKMPGFIGMEAADIGSEGEISVIYWKDEASILEWKNNAEHLAAQKLGKNRFYQQYAIRVAKVERAYDFAK